MMPYSSISEARIKKLNGVALTLAQVNWIANVADKLKEEGEVDNPWAVAISQFKRSFHVEGNKWVKNEKSEEKDFDTDVELEITASAFGDMMSTVTKGDKKYKTEDGKQFPASDYAYVPDPDLPSTWKLRMTEEPGGKPTLRQLGRAAAAFSPGGFRGNKVQIPAKDVAGVKAKLRAEYKKLGVKGDEVPEHIKDAVDASGRWITVSTVDEWDREGERFSKDAMDYDIERAYNSGEYPEMRVFHVRGLNIGKADKMYRVGRYAVDEGYFYDDEFSAAMKDELSNNSGKWKVSRGFYVKEATGLCRKCGTGLRVTDFHDLVGFECPECGTYHQGHRALKDLVFKKVETFDISVTTVPIVPDTSVSAYSVGGNNND